MKAWGPATSSYISSFSIPISCEIFIIQDKNLSQVIPGFLLQHKMSKRVKITAGKEWFNLVTNFLQSNYFFKNLGFAKSITITSFIMSTE